MSGASLPETKARKAQHHRAAEIHRQIAEVVATYKSAGASETARFRRRYRSEAFSYGLNPAPNNFRFLGLSGLACCRFCAAHLALCAAATLARPALLIVQRFCGPV